MRATCGCSAKPLRRWTRCRRALDHAFGAPRYAGGCAGCWEACWRQSSARMAGSWLRRWASGVRTGCNGCSAEADWDQEAVRDDLRTYVLPHLEGEADVLVVDETGFLKKGKKSAGVAPQYSGTAGGRANSQIGVFLLYASAKGAAFIDREVYLPEEWTEDPVRCREAGIPGAVGFATKGALAQRMLARAFAAGVRAAWVVGDTIYGADDLRTWLQTQQQADVLAVAADAARLGGRTRTAGGASRRPLARRGVGTARGGWRSWILIRRS